MEHRFEPTRSCLCGEGMLRTRFHDFPSEKTSHPIADGLVVGDLLLHVHVQGVPVSPLGVLHQGPEALLEVVEELEVAYPHPVADDLGRVRRPDALGRILFSAGKKCTDCSFESTEIPFLMWGGSAF